MNSPEVPCSLDSRTVPDNRGIVWAPGGLSSLGIWLVVPHAVAALSERVIDVRDDRAVVVGRLGAVIFDWDM